MIESRAEISPCGLYRYSLLRRWAPGPTLGIFMLNPSKADAHTDDPTIRRCLGFGQAFNFGAIEIGNVGAYRATSPRDFFAATAPFGPRNRDAIAEISERVDWVIVAWGALPKRPVWVREEAALLLDALSTRHDLYSLDVTKHGFPAHPLYLPGDLKPVLYRPRIRS